MYLYVLYSYGTPSVTKYIGGENVIDTNKLRGIIAERGLSQSDVAESIGITPKTFYEKMKRGVFDSDEMDTMITLLRISDPVGVFFAHFGA